MNEQTIQDMINTIARALLAEGKDVVEIEDILVMQARRVSDDMIEGVFA